MSRFEFKLPDIGEGVTEGEIVNWLVHAGDQVSESQDIVEVMTDKATVTIGAPKTGKVVEVRGQTGDVVPVGSVLVVFELDGGAEAAPAPKSAPRQAEAPRAAAPVASAVGDLKEVLPGVPKEARIVEEQLVSDKPLASPATRKLARELGVDLRHVRPSGEGDRVTREDVEQAARSAREGAPSREQRAPARAEPRAAEAAESTRVALAPVPPPPRISAQEGERRVPIRGIRKRIYENMARAKRTAAHFTYVDECDVTALEELKTRSRAQGGDAAKITYLPFIVKAVVASLRAHPELNCLVDDAAMEIVLRNNFDIGIAVATDAGLTVPVLRRADQLTILEITRELERLGSEARAGKSRLEDLGGSSFTITSLGKLGGLFATPVVNYPEVAILGVHEIKRRPVVKNDQIVVGNVMLLSLSFDHRIIDGHVGAAFAQEVIGYLQAPERLLLEMR